VVGCLKAEISASLVSYVRQHCSDQGKESAVREEEAEIEKE